VAGMRLNWLIISLPIYSCTFKRFVATKRFFAGQHDYPSFKWDQSSYTHPTMTGGDKILKLGTYHRADYYTRPLSVKFWDHSLLTNYIK